MDIYFWEKWLPHETLPFYSFIPTSIWKWHSLVMYLIYGIEEINISWENLCCIIWYINRNSRVLKTIIIMCLLLQRGMTTPWIPLITLCYSPFLWMFIYLGTFHSVAIFNGLILLVSVDAITWIYSLTFVFKIYLCLVSGLMGMIYKYYGGWCLVYYKCLLLARMILFNPCLMCNLLYVIYEC